MTNLFKSLVVFILLAGCSTLTAQNYDPAVGNALVGSGCPIAAQGGTTQISFDFVNSGDELPLVPTSELTMLISLQLLAPLNGGGIAAISGSASSWFTWQYDGNGNFFGTQNQPIPAASGGSIVIATDITGSSIITLQQNGFGVNLQPPGYTASSNDGTNDEQFKFCHTLDPVTCDADNGILSFSN